MATTGSTYNEMCEYKKIPLDHQKTGVIVTTSYGYTQPLPDGLCGVIDKELEKEIIKEIINDLKQDMPHE